MPYLYLGFGLLKSLRVYAMYGSASSCYATRRDASLIGSQLRADIRPDTNTGGSKNHFFLRSICNSNRTLVSHSKSEKPRGHRRQAAERRCDTLCFKLKKKKKKKGVVVIIRNCIGLCPLEGIDDRRRRGAATQWSLLCGSCSKVNEFFFWTAIGRHPWTEYCDVTLILMYIRVKKKTSLFRTNSWMKLKSLLRHLIKLLILMYIRVQKKTSLFRTNSWMKLKSLLRHLIKLLILMYIRVQKKTSLFRTNSWMKLKSLLRHLIKLVRLQQF
ncbi:unnamed protein product, partial [Trichogramma brassicae]